MIALAGADSSFAQSMRSPILTIDSERLYRDSVFGQRVLQEIEAHSARLAEENRTIEEKLEQEEAELTKQRSEMEAAEFRALADAFDARVQAIRREREAKNGDIASELESNRDRFLTVALPILEAIMLEAGAGIVLEQRSVFISANAIDITDRAISRVNAALGDGTESADD
ncbi:MAG: OmpH family outer membrane protein [Tateyamaria sp.]|uniref:OmpH family outer membrane protein n=1 Tax=Tateyamaria sp. TaxID=1929288 RepID=UPI00329AA610